MMDYFFKSRYIWRNLLYFLKYIFFFTNYIRLHATHKIKFNHHYKHILEHDWIKAMVKRKYLTIRHLTNLSSQESLCVARYTGQAETSVKPLWQLPLRCPRGRTLIGIPGSRLLSRSLSTRYCFTIAFGRQNLWEVVNSPSAEGWGKGRIHSRVTLRKLCANSACTERHYSLRPQANVEPREP